ncbi:MAG TPA: hypothetical protein VI756_13475 [Blastocatellia bacterium]
MNNSRKHFKMAVIGLIATVLAVTYACKKPQHTAAEPAAEASPSPTPSPGSDIIGAAPAKLLDQNLKFDHNRAEHKKQDCTLCHVRTDNNPEPTFPKHSACLACHTTDFTSSNNKFCVVCHVVPVPPKGDRISFPATLGQFGVKGFSHKTHLDPAKMPAGTAVPKCGTCHSFDAQFIQASFPAHPQCYSCHSHQAGEKLGSCQTCHIDRGQAMNIRKGTGPAYALYNFTHGGHFRQASIDQNCEKCHHLAATAASGNLPDIGQINTARGQRHTSACWSCHVQAREPVCTKCHVHGTPT